MVCGRRQADRYRVPFVGSDPRDAVPTERARLLESKQPTCGQIGAFFNNCGHVGVSATFGGGGVTLKTRKLAP
jgi:hypothetical protein